MRKSLGILLSFILFSFTVIAQNIEFKSSNFKDNKDGFKAAETNLEAGNELFKQALKLQEEGKNPYQLFKQAQIPFTKAQEFNPNNAELNYKIGKCLYFSKDIKNSIPFFQKSLKLDEKNAEPDLYYLLGKALKNDYKFADAKALIQKYKTVERSKILEKNLEEINRELTQCDNAEALYKTPLARTWVENMKDWNSEYDDYGATITADESSLAFNSKRQSKATIAKDEFGQYSTIVMQSTRDKGKWSPLIQFGEPFTSPGIFEISAYSYDGQSMILYKPGPNGDLYQCDLEGAKWNVPYRLPDKVNTDANEYQACYSGDKIRIYYVTDQPYGNRGGTDIYFSGLMNPKLNTWGMGQTIGSELNTTVDDGYIFLHADDKTIYFSSKGHNSMGGFDIFKSERLAGRWSTPVNLGYPINTVYDETSFVMSASGKHAYITSDRDGGKGGSDIYKVTYLGPIKPPVPDIQDQLLADIAAPQKDNKLEEAVKVESKNLTILKGRVLDDYTGNPIKADIEIVDNQKNEIILSIKSNSSTGKFLVSLPAGKNYGIAVKAPDYLFHSENFDLPETSDFQLVEKDIRLKGACIGCKIILKNIFFDSGKFIIRPESTSELTRLADLIKDIARVKPGIKIEISGHTDNVGSETSNQQLSENRAKAVVKYLVDHGIAQTKLSFKGYGSKEAVVTNSTAEGRQENRRTEFKILED